MKDLIKLLFLIIVGLFCWSWYSHCIKGSMTASQYLQKLDKDFQQAVLNGTNRVLKTEYASRIVRNTQDFYDANDAAN